jgi:hypothetical protein
VPIPEASGQIQPLLIEGEEPFAAFKGMRPRLGPPDLSDPRLATPKRSDSPPLALPAWFTSTVGLLTGVAMVGGGAGLAAQGRKPGPVRPVAGRREVSRRRAWLEAIACWGAVFQAPRFRPTYFVPTMQRATPGTLTLPSSS